MAPAKSHLAGTSVQVPFRALGSRAKAENAKRRVARTAPVIASVEYILMGKAAIYTRQSNHRWLPLNREDEFRRWLRKQGCVFVEESRHTRIMLGSKVARMPRHPAKEIKMGTLQSILKDLDLKM